MGASSDLTTDSQWRGIDIALSPTPTWTSPPRMRSFAGIPQSPPPGSNRESLDYRSGRGGRGSRRPQQTRAKICPEASFRRGLAASPCAIAWRLPLPVLSLTALTGRHQQDAARRGSRRGGSRRVPPAQAAGRSEIVTPKSDGRAFAPAPTRLPLPPTLLCGYLPTGWQRPVAPGGGGRRDRRRLSGSGSSTGSRVEQCLAGDHREPRDLDPRIILASNR